MSIGIYNVIYNKIIIVFTAFVCGIVYRRPPPPSCWSSCRQAPIGDDEVPCSLGLRGQIGGPWAVVSVRINKHKRPHPMFTLFILLYIYLCTRAYICVIYVCIYVLVCSEDSCKSVYLFGWLELINIV